MLIGGLATIAVVAQQNQAAQRRAQLALAERDLGIADGELRANSIVAAKQSLLRAEALLQEDSPPPLLERFKSLWTAYELAEDLQRIQENRATAASHMLHGNTNARDEYRGRFEDARLNPFAGNRDQLAETIQGSPVVLSILSALDSWALVCAFRMRIDPAHADTYRQQRDDLVALARQVDVDPSRKASQELRISLRNPRVWSDRTQLENLAGEAIADLKNPNSQLSPSLIALFAQVLSDAKLDAETLLRTARDEHAGDFWINFQLGRLLAYKYEEKRARNEEVEPEGLIYLHSALALRPQNSAVLSVIGAIYSNSAGKSDIGIQYLLRAIEADPKNAAAYNGLGVTYRDRDEYIKAVDSFREARSIEPNFMYPKLNLGSLLPNLGEVEEGLEFCREALALDPDASDVNYRYGGVLQEHGRFAEAETRYQKALAGIAPNRWPPRSWINNSLANTLAIQGRIHDAIALYREVTAHEKQHALALTNLATALEEAGGDLPEIMALHARAIEAIDQRPRSIRLRDDERQRAVVETNLKRAHRLERFNTQLLNVDAGRHNPADADECLGFAEACLFRKRHADAVHFYTEAFRLAPDLVANLDSKHRLRGEALEGRALWSLVRDANLALEQRFNAARAAVLAYTGQKGADLNSEELRRQALTWLRESLNAWHTLVSADKRARTGCAWHVSRWRRHADLAAVRDPAARDALPDGERAEWQMFWDDAEALLITMGDEFKEK